MRPEIYPCVISFYRIYCRNPDVVDSYIGHTNKLPQRKAEHFSRYKNPTDPAFNRPIYKTIRAHGGIDNWEFEEIERVECESCDYARHIEQDLIGIHGANLNKSFAYSRPAKNKSNTYYATHRDAILQKYKDARLELKERILMSQNDICV